MVRLNLSRLLLTCLALSFAFSPPAVAEEVDTRSAEEKHQAWKNEQLRQALERQAEAGRRRKAEEEAERGRQAEAERRRKAEAERERQAEAERRRKAEAEREREAEAGRRHKAEEKAERERQAEAERRHQAELERERLAEERRRKAEVERQHRVGIERRRQAEAVQRRLEEAKAAKELRDKLRQEEAERLLEKKQAERQAKEHGLKVFERAEEQFAGHPAEAYAALEDAAKLENPLAKAMLALWGGALAGPGTGRETLRQADAWLDKLTEEDIRQLRWMAEQQGDVLAQMLLGQLFALDLIEADPQKDPKDPAQHFLALAQDNEDPIPQGFLARVCRLNADDRRPGVEGLAGFCQAKLPRRTVAPPEPAGGMAGRPVPLLPPPPGPNLNANPVPPAMRVIEPKIVRVPVASGPFGPQEAGFGLARHELSFAEWDACVAAGGCPRIRRDGVFDQDLQPVINVSWLDAQNYILWLNKATGKHYRLPTGEEWDYAALAGAQVFPLNRCAVQANFNDSAGPCLPRAYQGRTVAVGRYRPNAFGLYDTGGNVREWVANCFEDPLQVLRCGVRGGSWQDGDPYRAPAIMPASSYNAQTGFRLALDLPY